MKDDTKPATHGPAVTLPFAGMVTIKATGLDDKGKQKPDREALGFGPYQTANGFEMLTASRGKTDKTQYEVGKVYFVRFQISVFGQKAYYQTI